MNKVAQSSIMMGVIGLAIGMGSAQPAEASRIVPVKTTSIIMANIARHHQVMMYGVPASYREFREPLPHDPAELRRGAAIFQRRCASCHGFSGHGDGPVGKRLSSPPANLAWLANTPMSRSGPYMYWTIAEGGREFGSDMPAYRILLSRDDIWAVIGYIQNGPSPPPARR